MMPALHHIYEDLCLLSLLLKRFLIVCVGSIAPCWAVAVLQQLKIKLFLFVAVILNSNQFTSGQRHQRRVSDEAQELPSNTAQLF